MRIFWNELKKLLNWKLLLILCLFTGLYYFMFLNYYLNDYTSGHPTAEAVELGKAMAEKYGPSLNAKEQKEFEAVDYPAIKQAAGRELAGIKEFRDTGITTVDEFNTLSDKKDDASKKLYEKLGDIFESNIPMNPARPDAYYTYQEARDQVIPQIDSIRNKTTAQHRISSALTGSARARSVRLEKREASDGISILPWPTTGSWGYLKKNLATLLLFTVAILITPFLVRERRSGVRDLVYTCRKGRPLFAAQFGASLVAAALAEAVQIAVFFVLFFNSPHRVDLLFFNCDCSGWWDMTFGQYIAWCCIILFVLAFGFAMVSFVVSKLCKNYIAALAVQIPLIFLMNALKDRITENPFNLFRPQYLEPVACGLCLFVPLILCLFLIHREKRTDILQ